MTLPERTLDLLKGINADRARAIVKAVDAATPTPGTDERVAVVEMSEGVGLLVMPFHQGLHDLPWLTMIEIATGRFLLTIEIDTPIERIELAIRDLLLDAEDTAPHEAIMLRELLERLGPLRRLGKIRKAEVLCVATPGDADAR